MSDQSDFEFASQFAASNEIEKAGQDILQSLHKAADVAEANRQTVQRLSHQLQNAENRIAELEAEVQLYKAKMDRAKQWLHKLFSQIEERFSQIEERLFG
jgi:chromosome segregation ATPase